MFRTSRQHIIRVKDAIEHGVYRESLCRTMDLRSRIYRRLFVESSFLYAPEFYARFIFFIYFLLTRRRGAVSALNFMDHTLLQRFEENSVVKTYLLERVCTLRVLDIIRTSRVVLAQRRRRYVSALQG